MTNNNAKKTVYLNRLWARLICKIIRWLKNLYIKNAYITNILPHLKQRIKNKKAVKIKVKKKF